MRRLIVFLIIAVFGIMCSEPDKTYTIETVDGVDHIRNLDAQWGEEQKISLEFVRKLGEMESDNDNYSFYRVADVAKDNEDNIYILDAGNFRIQKFDKDGKYITTIGSEGQGPGELMNPAGMCIDEENRIFVTDIENNRVQIYSTDGNDISSFPMNRSIRILRNLPDGSFVTNANYIPEPEFQDEPGHLMEIIDTDGNSIREFGSILKTDEYRLALFINSIIIDTDPRGNIFVSYRNENRIEKYSPEGALLARIDRPVDYEINHRIEEQKIPFGNRVLDIGVPRLTFVSGGMGIDSKDRIWVMTFKRQPPPEDVKMVLRVVGEGSMDLKQEPEEDDPSKNEAEDEILHRLEIFDNDGILLEYCPLPVGTGTMRIIGDRIFFFGSDDMFVYEYRITDN
ncbi:NHL repeat-containing protein [candidate division KSB1 bacterium]